MSKAYNFYKNMFTFIKNINKYLLYFLSIFICVGISNNNHHLSRSQIKINTNSTFFLVIIFFLLFVVFTLLFLSIITIGFSQFYLSCSTLLNIFEYINIFSVFVNSIPSYLIIFLFVFTIFMNFFMNDFINVRSLLFISFFIFLSCLYFKFHCKEPVLLLCEEKKTKLFWYTYHFGICKYLIADQNEIGSNIFSTVYKDPNQVLIPTGHLTEKVEIIFYITHWIMIFLVFNLKINWLIIVCCLKKN